MTNITIIFEIKKFLIKKVGILNPNPLIFLYNFICEFVQCSYTIDKKIIRPVILSDFNPGLDK